MAVFVTGGYGQIASWAVYFLAKEGQRVIVYDVNPHAPDYLAEVVDNITFVKGDVLDMARLTDTVKKYQAEIDGIIHSVGIMGEHVQLNAHHNVTLNVMGVVNMLEVARIFDIKKIVYTSTGAVYGVAPGIVPEDTPLAPTDLYAATKVSSEHIGAQYANTFGLDFRVARLFFTYGPGKIPSHFINLYKISFGALEGIQNLKIERGADQQVDYTYTVDAGEGVALLYKAENLQHQAFNISAGKAHTVGEVAALSQKYTHFPVDVEVGPGELMRRCEALDITLAREELGFEPRHSIEEGIQCYADWLKEQREK
jgi:nucleoside-diphosphate-sugar epimerase